VGPRPGTEGRVLAAASAEYLARIGLAAPPVADPAGLAALVRAHRLAVPFENLDILLGRAISLAPEALLDKLVRRRRGGYCFEQNLLLAHMLAVFGLRTDPLLARVRLGLADGPAPPRTHLLLRAEIAGHRWIADAGFGGSYAPPLILAETSPVEGPDGISHRLRRTGERGRECGEWLLERSADRGRTWQAQYSFDDAAVPHADIECANHWTSTRPGTRFTTHHIASRATPDGMAALTDLSFTASGQEEARTVADAGEWHRLLNEILAVPLSLSEVSALPLFAR